MKYIGRGVTESVRVWSGGVEVVDVELGEGK